VFESKIHNLSLGFFSQKLTLYCSPLRIFFCRNFSKLGGATSTVYGFKSDDLSNFRLCGCKLSTQILPLFTTARIASREVPGKLNYLIRWDTRGRGDKTHHNKPFHTPHAPQTFSPEYQPQTAASR
jgi:hypothetical protein